MQLGPELVRSGKLEAGLDRYWEAFHLVSARPASAVTPEWREALLTQLTAHLMRVKRFSNVVELWRLPFAKDGGLTASQHYQLGAALLELKQPAEAAEQMRECLATRHRPAFYPIIPEIHKAAPHHLLGRCLVALNDAEGAHRAFNAALAAEPSSRPVRCDLATSHAAQGRISEAVKILRQMAEEDPTDPQVWELGGKIALAGPDTWSSRATGRAKQSKIFPRTGVFWPSAPRRCCSTTTRRTHSWCGGARRIPAPRGSGRRS